jgi:shikimate kinase
MSRTASNLVLIGMPGAGKSTVGVILAKRTARAFLDTDVLIQTTQGRSLQEIVDTDSYAALRQIEEGVLLGLSVRDTVIATGGSAVYSDRAMRQLKLDAIVVFLDVDLPILLRRVADFSTRGLAKRRDQTFFDLFNERRPLYTQYADITIPSGEIDQDDVCRQIIEELSRFR